MYSVLALHPAALGLILGVPKKFSLREFFSWCCWDLLTALQCLVSWQCRSLIVDRIHLVLLDSTTKKLWRDSNPQSRDYFSGKETSVPGPQSENRPTASGLISDHCNWRSWDGSFSKGARSLRDLVQSLSILKKHLFTSCYHDSLARDTCAWESHWTRSFLTWRVAFIINFCFEG